MSHVINSRAFSGEKRCINKAIHAMLMHGYATFNCNGARFAAVTRCVLPGPRTSIVRGNCVRETSVKRRNKISARNNVKCSKCFQFLCNNSDLTWFFQCINIRQVPWDFRLAAFGLGFQHLPRDLANVNA